MENVDLANAMIAAALIQSGQFKLSDYDERGQPIPVKGATNDMIQSAYCDRRRRSAIQLLIRSGRRR